MNKYLEYSDTKCVIYKHIQLIDKLQLNYMIKHTFTLNLIVY